MAIRSTAPVVAGGLALLGGTFFGLFSCGGYRWHSQLFWAVLVICLAVVVVFPSPRFLSKVRRIGFVAVTLAVFTITQAAASAFYPAAPISLTDFAHRAWVGLLTAPC